MLWLKRVSGRTLQLIPEDLCHVSMGSSRVGDYCFLQKGVAQLIVPI